jgi:hypothetical protein
MGTMGVTANGRVLRLRKLERTSERAFTRVTVATAMMVEGRMAGPRRATADGMVLMIDRKHSALHSA